MSIPETERQRLQHEVISQKQAKKPVNLSGSISTKAFNRVVQACEAAGLDPAEEIIKVLNAGACPTCGHNPKLSPKTRAELWAKLLEFTQPKLRAIEGDLNIKQYSLVDILTHNDE